MNEYEVKFARERKDKPTDWVIVQNIGWGYRLVQIGGFENPTLTLVETDFSEIEQRVAAHIEDMELLRSMDYGMMP